MNCSVIALTCADSDHSSRSITAPGERGLYADRSSGDTRSCIPWCASAGLANCYYDTSYEVSYIHELSA